AALPLLGRLEDEMHGAVEAPRLAEVARGGKEHRRVTVVAAGVHLAGVRRAMLEPVRLVYGQRVHVRPQPDRPRALAGAQHADHARASDPGVYFAAECPQLFGDDRSRAALFEPELRV